VSVTEDLTHEDLGLILESLGYTRRAFGDYTGYPSYEFKQQRLADVDAVVAKLRAIRDRLKADLPQTE